MVAHKINSMTEFKDALENNEIVIVDFWATWCGPCRMISPIAEKLSESFEKVHFCTVDVDQVPDVSEEYDIRAMPTFLLFKNGEKTDEVVGADPPKLEQMFVTAV